MKDIKQLELEIAELVSKADAEDNIHSLTKLLARLQFDYMELATLMTDGNYHEGWTHTQILDYFTEEGRL